MSGVAIIEAIKAAQVDFVVSVPDRVTSPTRFALFPELPTVASILPGYESGIWYGVMAPAGTPPAMVNRIQAEIARQLQAPEVREKLASDGSVVVANTPEAFGALLRAEHKHWVAAVKSSGARID